jgi:uncharacterized protein with HEPN domain
LSIDRRLAHATDMLDFVRELRALVGAQTLEQYLQQRILNLAVEKLFINLGEAAYRLGPQTSGELARVPLRQMIGLRNILAHGYEQVAHETLYRTVREDLPATEAALAAWLQTQASADD